MKDLKLFCVSHMEGKPCSRFIAAESEEQAFLHCYSKEEERYVSSKSSCKVEEVKIEGYEILVRKIS